MEHLKKIFGYFKEEYTKLYAVKNLERRGARYILVFVILIVFFGFFSIKFVQNRSQWVTELPLISRTEGIDVYAKVYGWTVGIVSIIALLQSIGALMYTLCYNVLLWRHGGDFIEDYLNKIWVKGIKIISGLLIFPSVLLMYIGGSIIKAVKLDKVIELLPFMLCTDLLSGVFVFTIWEIIRIKWKVIVDVDKLIYVVFLIWWIIARKLNEILIPWVYRFFYGKTENMNRGIEICKKQYKILRFLWLAILTIVAFLTKNEFDRRVLGAFVTTLTAFEALIEVYSNDIEANNNSEILLTDNNRKKRKYVKMKKKDNKWKYNILVEIISAIIILVVFFLVYWKINKALGFENISNETLGFSFCMSWITIGIAVYTFIGSFIGYKTWSELKKIDKIREDLETQKKMLNKMFDLQWFARRNDREKAYNMYNELLDLDHDNASALLQKLIIETENTFEKEDYKENSERRAYLKKQYKNIRKIFDNEETDESIRYEAYLTWGCFWGLTGDYKKSIEYLGKAEEIREDDPDLYRNRAVTYALDSNEDIQKVIKDLNTAIALSKRNLLVNYTEEEIVSVFKEQWNEIEEERKKVIKKEFQECDELQHDFDSKRTSIIL